MDDFRKHRLEREILDLKHSGEITRPKSWHCSVDAATVHVVQGDTPGEFEIVQEPHTWDRESRGYLAEAKVIARGSFPEVMDKIRNWRLSTVENIEAEAQIELRLERHDFRLFPDGESPGRYSVYDTDGNVCVEDGDLEAVRKFLEQIEGASHRDADASQRVEVARGRGRAFTGGGSGTGLQDGFARRSGRENASQGITP